MASMTFRFSRDWRVEVQLAEGEVPDLTKRHTSLVMRPSKVIIPFHSQDGQAPSMGTITIMGRRVNKAGLGVDISERLYSRDEHPDWLPSMIERARALLNVR